MPYVVRHDSFKLDTYFQTHMEAIMYVKHHTLVCPWVKYTIFFISDKFEDTPVVKSTITINKYDYIEVGNVT